MKMTDGWYYGGNGMNSSGFQACRAAFAPSMEPSQTLENSACRSSSLNDSSAWPEPRATSPVCRPRPSQSTAWLFCSLRSGCQ